MDFVFNLITGLPAIAELVAAGIMVLAGAYNIAFRTYVTYILTHPATGQVYIGRASGFGEVSQILQRRFSNHTYYACGFTVVQVDRAMQGRKGRRAIRGREQHLIDHYGGIHNPTVANKIRAVSVFNPRRLTFHNAAITYFGEIV